MDVKLGTSQKGDATQKNPLELLTKEEIISKYKGLLGIAKKAKQAKDDLTEDNRKLKEELLNVTEQKDADKKALLTMSELIERFTQNKLDLSTKLDELTRKSRDNEEEMAQLATENESLKRQLERLTEDNEVLLQEVDRMECQLKQVNIFGMEQKKNLALLELEVTNLKEAERMNATLTAKFEVMSNELKVLREEKSANEKCLEDLEERYRKVKEINIEQRDRCNAFRERFVEMQRKLKNMKECKKVLLETHSEYADSVTKWKDEITDASRLLCTQMYNLQHENEELQAQMREKEDAAKETSDRLCLKNIAVKLEELGALGVCAAEEDFQRNLQFVALERENTWLREHLDALFKETPSGERSGDELNNQIAQLEEYRMKLQTLQAENEELKNNLQMAGQSETVCAECLQNTVRLTELETEIEANVEKKCELENLVQHLKEEKDTLTHQLLEKTNAEAKLSELIPSQYLYEELQMRYEQKEREHSDLLGEMRELNEALKARGDVISRQQERHSELTAELTNTTNKLKTLEEQLGKNEAYLIEKKNQIMSVSTEIEAARNKIAELENTCAKNEEHVRTLNEELQSLRNADTTIDAQSDVLSTSTTSRAEDLARLRDLDDSFEEKYNKLRGLAMKLKKKLQDQTAVLAEMEKQQNTNSALKKDLENYKQKCKGLETELEQQHQQVDTLTNENHKLKASRKQANVLNLEIEAAEKSLNEVSMKLATKTSELDALRETLASKEDAIVQLRREISIIESAKEAECVHSKELKEQIDVMQQQIKDIMHSKQSILMSNQDLEQKQDNLKLELDAVRQKSLDLEQENVSKLADVCNEKAQLEQKLVETDEMLKATAFSLKTTVHSLEELRAEYLEYKVKAQTVLRKNQGKDLNREREKELEEDLATLRAKEKQLQGTLQKQSKKIEESDQQIEHLRAENESYQHRINELLEFVQEFREQNESLTLNNRKQLEQQQEMLQTHLDQIAKLDACHREQLKEVEATYRKQIEQIQTENAKETRGSQQFGAVVRSMSVSYSGSEFNRLDGPIMQREDAEGSETAELSFSNLATNRKISNASLRRSGHDFLPLDELLNTPMNTITDCVTTYSTSSLGRNTSSDGNCNLDNVHVALQDTKDRLQIQESRVRHLTALLAENEQDLAKLTQLNDMLKEEVRRQQRTVEREQHMQNSEYLKNIVLKFLTLNNGDERTRLVPVLNTILKLSPTETDVLSCVAKGQKTESGGSRSWGSFLPSWSNQ